MSYTNFIKIEQARADVFNIFTALFCQPDKAVLKNKKIFKTLQTAFTVVYPDGLKNLEHLKAALDKYSISDLSIEYSRLFVGPFQVVAPPYSSVYLSQEYSLMSEETLWVMDFYRKMGLVYDIKLMNPPDHIAIETEFIYYLIYLEFNALQKKDLKKAKSIWKNQGVFFKKHFKKWVPVFCAKITDGTENEYYKALANCLKQFVVGSTLSKFPIEAKEK